MEITSTVYRPIAALLLTASATVSCILASGEAVTTYDAPRNKPTPTAPLSAPTPNPAVPQLSLKPESTPYSFPAAIDPSRRYLFYLHGKIIEDQGLPAISVDYGEYEYEAILSQLESDGFVVVSEQRPKNTDVAEYAQRIVAQIGALLKAKVPPESITVVGASKGAYIAATVSYLLKNTKTNFVLLGACHPSMVEQWKQQRMSLYGNILTIYDSADLEYSGSCEELFALSEGNGIGRHEEIVLHIGTGHGILYKPLDEWISPTVHWARQK